MALTNAEKQKRWRDRRNALARQAEQMLRSDIEAMAEELAREEALSIADHIVTNLIENFPDDIAEHKANPARLICDNELYRGLIWNAAERALIDAMGLKDTVLKVECLIQPVVIERLTVLLNDEQRLDALRAQNAAADESLAALAREIREEQKNGKLPS